MGREDAPLAVSFDPSQLRDVPNSSFTGPF
jgi:hypothetical protein